MKKTVLILVLMLLTLCSQARVQSVCGQLYLQVRFEDPTVQHEPIKKSPVIIPSLYLDGQVLQLITPCDGCTLRLLNRDGSVEYAIIIPTDTTSITFPAYLLGEYEIQIIRGNYCFWGYVNL